jgi:hypothetical protein
MYIKPREVQTQDGLVLAQVYDPERKDRLPVEGRDVPDTPYWRRRIAEGGVEFGSSPPDPAERGTRGHRQSNE